MQRSNIRVADTEQCEARAAQGASAFRTSLRNTLGAISVHVRHRL